MDEAHAIVADDPLRERAWRLLLLAQYRSGRQIDALRSYRWLQGLLAAELGADPSPALQRLNWQMQHQDPRLDLRPPRPPLVMPAAVATFVGRAGQIDAVAEALSDSRLVTLHGPAGVGKSRLAQEVAHHVRDRYSEGVWWVDLTVAGDLPEVLARLVGTLGVSVPPNASATDVLAAHLRYRELLLVLDNCEHVAGLLPPVLVSPAQGRRWAADPGDESAAAGCGRRVAMGGATAARARRWHRRAFPVRFGRGRAVPAAARRPRGLGGD